MGSVGLWRLEEDVAQPRRVLRRGGVLAIPTESSYGLGVDPRSQAGVAAVYAIKQRGWDKPLPVVVRDRLQAEALGFDTGSAPFRFAEQFWPAPLTALVPVRSSSVAASCSDAQCSDRKLSDETNRDPRRDTGLALGDLESVAVRIPDHPPLLALLGRLGHGLTATSANLAGRPPLLGPEAVIEFLRGTPGDHETLVVDSPPLQGGAPSTVVAWRQGKVRVLRRGRFVW